MFPAFSVELRELIEQAGHPHLAEQVATLPVVARCTCGDHFCAQFYTAPPPEPAYPPSLENVLLDPDRGMIVLDVVGKKIVAVEVLGRPDVKAILDKHFGRS